MKQIERIERMEQNLERATDALRVLNDALDEYEAAQDALHELEPTMVVILGNRTFPTMNKVGSPIP